MEAYSLVISFVFGAIIGSFLNVLAIRFNTGVGVGGRSKCMSCGSTLTWKELIPLASFIYQKGACKKCRSKISWQYPLVEFAAGAIFALIFVVFPPVTALAAISTLMYAFATCLLLVMTVYDIKHKIIPDQFSYVFIALSFVSLFIGGSSWLHVPSLSAILAGPILALPFALIWLISKGTWMGLGDSKLILGIGWFLGMNRGANALILAFWIAAAISVAWMAAVRKSYKPRTEIPFGPYLILGFYLVLLFNIQVMDMSMVKEIFMSYL